MEEDMEVEALKVLAAAAQARAQQKKTRFDGVVIDPPKKWKGPPGILEVGVQKVPVEEVWSTPNTSKEGPQYQYQSAA